MYNFRKLHRRRRQRVWPRVYFATESFCRRTHTNFLARSLKNGFHYPSSSHPPARHLHNHFSAYSLPPAHSFFFLTTVYGFSDFLFLAIHPKLCILFINASHPPPIQIFFLSISSSTTDSLGLSKFERKSSVPVHRTCFHK